MPAIDAAKMRQAVARLGDAVIDPATWPDILQEISAAVGAEGAVLLQSDVRTPDVPRTASLENLTQTYFRDDWHMRDLRAERAVPLLSGNIKVLTDEDLVTPEEMLRSDFYNDLVRANGLHWFAVVGFRAGTNLWGLSVHRTSQQGPFEAEGKASLAELSGKLTEIATLSTVAGRAALQGVVNALGFINQGVIAIDRNGSVLEVNAAAEQIFDQTIRVAFRRLMLADASAERTFEIFLDRLRIASDRIVLPLEHVFVRRQGRPPVVIKILPVDGAARGAFLGARALLLLTELGLKRAPKEELLARAYGLSPAEARLAAHLAIGSSLENIADEFGIALATARNQLKAVLAKTETHRQGELVALLARL